MNINNNFGMVTEAEWIGLSVHDAQERAELSGFTHRIVEQNGTSFMVDANYKSNRLNFRINNDKVVGVFPG